METLKHEMQNVLENNILKFWIDKMTDCTERRILWRNRRTRPYRAQRR
jgi:hypothetical protein